MAFENNKTYLLDRWRDKSVNSIQAPDTPCTSRREPAAKHSWAIVCKTVRPMLPRTVVCLSSPVSLSVTLVYCGQTVRWIKMPLGTKVGLVPGHIVLDGDPTPPAERGTAGPHFSAHFVSAGRPSQQLMSSFFDARSID